MIQGILRASLITLTALATANCASNYTTSGAAVGYNRSFADARNEIILLNILRASVGEPLQFSTISTVQGGAHNSTGISIPFTNVIAGGADEISPTITLGPRNPNATVTPLESREFIAGILRSVSVETIDNLITQGYPRPTVLALAIGGVQCADRPDGTENVIMNFGPLDARDVQFRRALGQSQNYTAATTDDSVRALRLPAADALKLLREGAGPGREVRLREKLQPGEAPRQAHEIDLSVVEVSSSLRGVEIQQGIPDCPPRTKENSRAWGLIPRSVHSMYRYLGQYQAQSMQQSRGACRNEHQDEGLARSEPEFSPLVRIRSACHGLGAPVSAAVSTTFRGLTYYVLRSDTATLEAMSLLAALTALQTSESSLAASRPIIAVPAQ